MTERFIEAPVEDTTLVWLEANSWQVAHGLEIAPDTSTAKRADFGEVDLAARLRAAIARLNPNPPTRQLELVETHGHGRGAFWRVVTH